MSEFAGTRRFAILRRLGAGGMGVVYEARDAERDRRVALKVLREVGAQSIYRFKNEFRALADLDHENLVRLDELHFEDDRWFFTMELVRGVDLLAWVQPGAPPSADGDSEAETRQQSMPLHLAPTALEVAPPVPDVVRGGGFRETRLRLALTQLAKGLSALHRAAKIHRDIKPSNVLVTAEGRVVLLDFGLVTDAFVDGRLGDRSMETRVVGTFAYMAPEQATGRPVGPPADWYGVGVVLYEALTGRLPFTGTPVEVLMKKLRGEPVPPRQLVPDVPPDLEALCLALLRPEPAARPPGPRVLEQLGVRTRSEPGLLAARSLITTGGGAFVGRSSELGALAAALAGARAVGGVSLFLHGESGIGKTSLVWRFLDQVGAEDREAMVLAGRCYERESLPYKAFDAIIDTLGRRIGRFSDSEVASILPRDAWSMGNVFPALRRVRAVAEAPAAGQPRTEPQERRSRAFGALREMLGKLAAARPVVLFIDDFQWADSDSLALFVDVMLAADAPRLLLLATVRGPAGGKAAELLQRAGAGAPISRGGSELRDLPITALSSSETRELILALGGAEARSLPGAVDLVARESAGHPLFVHELVRHQNAIGAEGSCELRLDAAIWSRIVELEAGARLLLEIVAVAGTPVSEAILADAGNLDPAECARWLALLRVSHLVSTSRARGTELIEPYHDRVREAVLANLDDASRKQHHVRLADALEARPDGGYEPRMLVSHLLQAGQGPRAAKHAERAARMASEALAFEQAAELYAIALEHARGGPAEIRTLRMTLARALVDAGRGPDAAEAYLAAVPGADAAARLGCQREAAQQLLMSGYLERGLEVLTAVLREIGIRLPRTPRRALLSFLWQRLKLRLRGLRWRERDASEISPADLTRVDVYRTATLGLGLVDTIRGADFQARGLLQALRTGEAARVGRALTYEAILRASQGPRSLVAAQALLGEARKIGRDRSDPYLLPVVVGAEGICLFFTGDFRGAADRLWEAEAHYREHSYAGSRWEVHNGRLFRLMALRHLGRLRELRQLFDRHLRDAVRRGDRYTETSMVRTFNVVWLAADDPVEARRQLDREIWMPPAGTFHLQHWYELMARGDLELYEGSAAGARARLAPMFRGLERSMLLRAVSTRIVCWWLRGRLALADAIAGQDPAKARAEASAMARALERERMQPAAAWAELLRAALAAQENRPEDAAALLRQARQRLESMGLELYAAAALRREGELEGGAPGREKIADADARMTFEGVVRPKRLAEVYAPGFR